MLRLLREHGATVADDIPPAPASLPASPPGRARRARRQSTGGGGTAAFASPLLIQQQHQQQVVSAVVSDTKVRTPKYLYGVIRGLPVLRPSWVQACAAAGKQASSPSYALCSLLALCPPLARLPTRSACGRACMSAGSCSSRPGRTATLAQPSPPVQHCSQGPCHCHCHGVPHTCQQLRLLLLLAPGLQVPIRSHHLLIEPSAAHHTATAGGGVFAGLRLHIHGGLQYVRPFGVLMQHAGAALVPATAIAAAKASRIPLGGPPCDLLLVGELGPRREGGVEAGRQMGGEGSAAWGPVGCGAQRVVRRRKGAGQGGALAQLHS